MSHNAYIKAISYYLPEPVEDNKDLRNEFPGRVDDDFIEKIGVRYRHYMPKDMLTSDEAVLAAEKFFVENPGINKADIDCLIYCSEEQDYISPSTSCTLQHRIGLPTTIATFDITHGCSGYLYGLAMAKGFIAGLNMKNVLFLTASLTTKFIDDTNLALRPLFGDASSATLITSMAADAPNGIGEMILGTDGSGFEKVIIRSGREAYPLTESSYIPRTDQFGNIYTDKCLTMDGQAMLLFIIKRVPKLLLDTLEKNEMQTEDIDMFFLHQANYFALELVRKKLQIPPEKFFYSMKDVGNTGQNSVPIGIKNAWDQGLIGPGSKVLIAGFGSGLSWGATILRF